MRPTAILPLLLLAATAAYAVPAAKPLRAMPAGLQPAVSPAAAAGGTAHASAAKPNTGKWLEDYDEAVAIATAANLPLFLNFTGSDWCPWCKFADDRVFSHKEWREYAATHVVPVFVDFPSRKSLSNKQREANDALKKRFGIGGFPTFLVLSPDGEKLLGRLGISRDESFMSFTSKLEQVLSGNAQ